MEQQEVKAYISKLNKDLKRVKKDILWNDMWRHSGFRAACLQKEKQDIEAAIRDCKSLLPQPWWRRLLGKIF